MKIKGISRIDSNHTHGWFVRIYRDGRTVSKFFSDGVHGDKQQALDRAQKYKEDYEREHPPSSASRRVRTKPQKNNKTGFAGISETYDRSNGGQGKKMPCFSVSWRPRPGVARTKAFHFSKYGGREAALEAAIAFRKQKEAEILEASSTPTFAPEEKQVKNPIDQMLAALKANPLRSRWNIQKDAG